MLITKQGVILKNGFEIVENCTEADLLKKKGTISHKILSNHTISKFNGKELNIKFDVLASHDITYVGIIQAAKASGLEQFPVPYVLTNCHNSLCSVGGTINEDDHVFGLSAAKKYGGIFVPAHIAVIHQFIREQYTKCGAMVLGSDSHTRYGALGTMGIGEGGPELVKQLLEQTYNIDYPEVILVYLNGVPKPSVGPQDVALSLIKEVFPYGFVKNKILEFVGPGIEQLSVDFRNGIDVMTTETTCLTSIWKTDNLVKEYYKIHNREHDFKYLEPDKEAYYDGAVIIDLNLIEPMIALPFHPSNVYSIRELKANPHEIFKSLEKSFSQIIGEKSNLINLSSKIIDNRIKVDQGIVAGCAGGIYENIANVANIVDNKKFGLDKFSLSVYPSSQPILSTMILNGDYQKLIDSGVIIKTAICGPCFGAGDIPSNNALSIRHTTRNFPFREGAKSNNEQFAMVALMDAKSIAATAINDGFLTGADEIQIDLPKNKYSFNEKAYLHRIYNGYQKANTLHPLEYGPNIKDWPELYPSNKHLILSIDSIILDSVTTTDELIPSGEISSFRSNPFKLSEFTLSRKDPMYVSNTKETAKLEIERLNLENNCNNSFLSLRIFEKYFKSIKGTKKDLLSATIGSSILALKPGDGSAREQAASCQRVLGGRANFALEYATKRYRSNLINWGIIPFIIKKEDVKKFKVGSFIIIQNIVKQLRENSTEFTIAATILHNDEKPENINLSTNKLSNQELEILLAGGLISYNAEYKKNRSKLNG